MREGVRPTFSAEPRRAVAESTLARLHRAGRVLLLLALLFAAGFIEQTQRPASPLTLDIGPMHRNYVLNSDLEADIFGWEADSQTVLTTSRGHQSHRALRLRGADGDSRRLSAFSWPMPVTSTVEGRSYHGSSWVRSTVSSVRVRLRIVELSSRVAYALSASESTVSLRTNSWTRLEVDHKAIADNSSLSITLSTTTVPSGGSVDVDKVTLTDGVRAPTSGSATRLRPQPLYDASASMGAPPISVEEPSRQWLSIAEVARSTAPYRAGVVPRRAQQNSPWKLVWSDEFEGGDVDRSRWNPLDRSTYGDGNGELACLLDRPDNVRLRQGVLKIVALKEPKLLKCGDADRRFPKGRQYSSAHLETQDVASFKYGRFEIRARVPVQHSTSKALWPAFWLRPVGGGVGELDVVEFVGSGADGEDTSNVVKQTIHFDYAGTYPEQTFNYRLPRGHLADGFHTFAAEWEKGEIRWYVDGVMTFVRNTRTTPWIDEAFHREFYLRLNMAVGSDWLGEPDALTVFPAEYQVDYVRVYQK